MSHDEHDYHEIVISVTFYHVLLLCEQLIILLLSILHSIINNNIELTVSN